ncbi:unnamed protein product, partial [Cyprideis torosa]
GTFSSIPDLLARHRLLKRTKKALKQDREESEKKIVELRKATGCIQEEGRKFSYEFELEVREKQSLLRHLQREADELEAKAIEARKKHAVESLHRHRVDSSVENMYSLLIKYRHMAGLPTDYDPPSMSGYEEGPRKSRVQRIGECLTDLKYVLQEVHLAMFEDPSVTGVVEIASEPDMLIRKD